MLSINPMRIIRLVQGGINTKALLLNYFLEIGIEPIGEIEVAIQNSLDGLAEKNMLLTDEFGIYKIQPSS